MSKVNDKKPFSSVSIVDFEHVLICWGGRLFVQAQALITLVTSNLFLILSTGNKLSFSSQHYATFTLLNFVQKFHKNPLPHEPRLIFHWEEIISDFSEL